MAAGAGEAFVVAPVPEGQRDWSHLAGLSLPIVNPSRTPLELTLQALGDSGARPGVLHGVAVAAPGESVAAFLPLAAAPTKAAGLLGEPPIPNAAACKTRPTNGLGGAIDLTQVRAVAVRVRQRPGEAFRFELGALRGETFDAGLSDYRGLVNAAGEPAAVPVPAQSAPAAAKPDAPSPKRPSPKRPSRTRMAACSARRLPQEPGSSARNSRKTAGG